MSRRREKRSSIALSVRALGTDPDGKSFRHPVCTLDVSAQGVRINGLRNVRVGQVLTLEYQNNKVRFEVVWVGEPGSPRRGQVGLRSIEREKSLADIQLPTGQYVDDWRPADIAGETSKE
jgi:PilZ domain